MALSETDYGYTHKKFNYGYSHKKLRLPVRQREPENINSTQLDQSKSGKCCNKNLFRPYALDENNTLKKRKIATSPPSLEENSTPAVSATRTSTDIKNLQDLQQRPQKTTLNIIATTNDCATATSSTQPSDCSYLSPNAYNIRLQRQRAALYMHYMAQLQQQNAPAMLQTAMGFPMGYPNVTAPIFNGC